MADVADVQESRSEEGLTVGLVDAIASTCRVLARRDMSAKAAQEALTDLYEDRDFQAVCDALVR